MRAYWLATFQNIGLTLASSLPFLVFFSAQQNIDMQGLLLLIAGFCAWCALAINNKVVFANLGRPEIGLLTIYIVCCLASFAISPHKNYGLLGAPYIRLGAGGLIACVGCGLLSLKFSGAKLLQFLYVGISAIALVSAPYWLVKFHSLHRIGGVFAQADIFACFLGCGLLLGLGMIRLHPARRKIIIINQIVLAGLLLLTLTRAVLVLVILLYLLWLLQTQRQRLVKLSLVLLASLIVLVGLHFWVPGRLTDTAYASVSLRYRLSLQSSALSVSQRKPLFGYGPGNLADALDCKNLSDKALLKTCRQGYFFNSSHNIFLDRGLAIGWLGGLSFFLFVVLAIYKGLRAPGNQKIFAYAALLIAGYYFTNVASVTLELLFWVLLIQIAKRSSRAST